MDIGVGDKVECVRDDWNPHPENGEVLPSKGRVYTVRGVYDCLGRVEAIFLEEIVNPPRIWAGGVDEFAFQTSFFRPVRTTDISVFENICLEVKAGQPRQLEDA